MSSFEVKVTLLSLFLISIIDGTYFSLVSSKELNNEIAGQKFCKPTTLPNQTMYTKTPFSSQDKIPEFRFTNCDMK